MTYDPDHDALAPEPAVTVKHDGPLPVRSRRPVSFTSEVFALTATAPVRILGRNPNRCRAIITAGAVMTLGADQAVTAATGFSLPANVILELTATDELWAVGAGTLTVLAEHYDGT